MITFSESCAQYMWVIADTILQEGAESGLVLWRQRMNSSRGCASDCPFGVEHDTAMCAHCLEGRLRTLNLYRQTPLSAECVYLRAADTLKNWLNLTPETNPAAA